MRIAHCSDFHLLSLAGARWLDFANKRWIGGLNLLANRGRHHKTSVVEALLRDLAITKPDHVVVTGDITNVALEQEFRFARELFDKVELGPENITVLPGNHDAYVKKGAKYFSKHFAPYFTSDEGWQWDDTDPWPIVRVRDGVAIIGISTSLQTPWFTAFGVMGKKQEDRLRSALTDTRLSGCIRLVAIHHPPAGLPARSRVRGLRDRDRFARVLSEVGADLVLHGHEHRDMYHELPGPSGAVPIYGIQSGSYEAGVAALAKRARYRIFELSSPGKDKSDPPIEGLQMRVWDPEGESFVAEAEGDPVAAVS